MKGLIKNEFVVSLLIGTSYFLLWAAALFISVNYSVPEFLMAYKYTCWQNSYVLFVTLLLFHVFLKFINRRKNKVIWSILAALIVSAFLVVGYPQWIKLGMRTGNYPPVEKEMMTRGYLVRGIIYQLYGIAYFTTIKLLLHIVYLNNRNNRLKLEKKTAELNYLKSQTNPHFLFNTLNNLYALAEEKSPLTAGAILRLSEILRYMLYESESALVSIEKEIRVIKEYIELEKMRYDDSLVIQISEDIDDYNQLVPPLLLIPLVENAFKHGVSDTINKPFIFINLSVREKHLFFVVENSKNSNVNGGQVKEHIGLGNLRRQIDLLFTNYKLEIENDVACFRLNLSINLDSYAKV